MPIIGVCVCWGCWVWWGLDDKERERECVCVIVRPALLHISRQALCTEQRTGGVHDDVTQTHAGHAVVVDGADADALQVSQGHQEIRASHRLAR